ncbi:MAG: DNA repair protein RecO [Candidatus Dadabacteria bacterium]|nr:DNA repair protein RecO [Candidatus Dadabacteria bacterium]NIQ13214.1 DNA repair protein RecO [Candidatus Dadabacteria bacterium]
MKKCEALVLKKSNYGEADIIVTFYTRELGKVKGLARQAKKSRKRFGGRLELFNHLNIDITLNDNKFNILNEVNIKRSYSGIMRNLETFLISSFIIEHLDILTIENEPNDQLFDYATEAFGYMEKNENILSNLLKFQLKALKTSGYEPDLKSDTDKDYINFDISKGVSISESKQANSKNIYKFYIDIIKIPEKMDIFLGKVAKNIKVLTKYMEYHVEKKFKTSQFLEELNL